MFLVKDEDLQVIVRKAVNCTDKPRIVSHRVESFSKQRHGIMGNHYILAVTVEVGTNDAVCLQFFIKTPPESTRMRDSVVDQWVSLEEVHFFQNIYPLLTNNYKGAKWCPQCYLAKPELLVFEDLRSAGFSIRRDGIYDEQSLKSVISTLARFHASSIIAEATATIGKQPLNRVYEQAFREKIFTDVGKGGRSNNLAFHTMQLLADKFHLDGSLLPDILKRLHRLVKAQPGACNVICHGDLWRSNIMFDDTNTKSGQAPNCMLVDYQMLRYASPNTDLAALLYVHASPQLRATRQLQLLQHYYSTLRETVVSSIDDHRQHQRVPSFDAFLQDYEKHRLVGMACACTRWPKVVFDSVMNDSLALQAWYFEKRIHLYESAIESDANYARVTRDCLMEFLEEGKRTLNL